MVGMTMVMMMMMTMVMSHEDACGDYGDNYVGDDD